jgi:hypothetical protein
VLLAVAGRLEPKAAFEIAAALTLATTKTTNTVPLQALRESLIAVLGDGRRKQCLAVASAFGCLSDTQSVSNVLLLISAMHKHSSNLLSDQDLVNLLKESLTVGTARRAVLDELEVRFQRRFADQWEFVRFAGEQKLGLDFTSPPKRR